MYIYRLKKKNNKCPQYMKRFIYRKQSKLVANDWYSNFFSYKIRKLFFCVLKETTEREKLWLEFEKMFVFKYENLYIYIYIEFNKKKKENIFCYFDLIEMN